MVQGREKGLQTQPRLQNSRPLPKPEETRGRNGRRRNGNRGRRASWQRKEGGREEAAFAQALLLLRSYLISSRAQESHGCGIPSPLAAGAASLSPRLALRLGGGGSGRSRGLAMAARAPKPPAAGARGDRVGRRHLPGQVLPGGARGARPREPAGPPQRRLAGQVRGGSCELCNRAEGAKEAAPRRGRAAFGAGRRASGPSRFSKP